MCTAVVDNDNNDDDNDNDDDEKASVSQGFVKQICSYVIQTTLHIMQVNILKGDKIDRRQVKSRFICLYILRHNM